MTNVDKIKLGDRDVAFVRKAGEVVWPEYAGRENMVLWYDFMGRTNSDTNRNIAEDLSGNGNHGQLVNFAFEEGSGYDDGLVFDGVDDYINSVPIKDLLVNGFTFSMVFETTVSTDHANRGGIAWYNNNLQSGASFHYRPVLQRMDIAFASPSTVENIVVHTGLTPYRKYTADLTYTIADKTFRVYIDGELVHTRYEERDIVLTGNNPLTTNWSSSGIVRRFKGKMMSQIPFNRALTPEEIQHNYEINKARWNLP